MNGCSVYTEIAVKQYVVEMFDKTVIKNVPPLMLPVNTVNKHIVPCTH